MKATVPQIAIANPAIYEAELMRRARNRIASFYPETGPLRRELYRKHVRFFAAGGRHEPMEECPEGCDGSPHRQRCFMAANRVGKSEGCGAYETALHLTGRYPEWWPGRRFKRAIKAWAAGDTAKTVRDIVQAKLFGEPGRLGEGMIPGDAIVKVAHKAGTADAIDTAWIRHVSGRTSYLALKSYDQRREAFQGTEQDLIWLDEEPPIDVYTECVMRTMTTDGLILLTFTPLMGMSEVVLGFMPEGTAPQ